MNLEALKQKQKINEKEVGVYNEVQNNRKEDIAEIIEIGEAIWECCASRIISEMESKTENYHIKEVLNCFDIKDAGNKNNKYSKSFENVRICT